MVTNIGLELGFDSKRSNTENLYYQLFGEWPEFDCSKEAAELLLMYLENLDPLNDVRIFFGIGRGQCSHVQEGKCYSQCKDRWRCKYCYKRLEESMEKGLQELRLHYPMEIKILYQAWDVQDFRRYSVIARSLLAQRAENRQLKEELERLRGELQDKNAEAADLAAEKAIVAEKSAELATLQTEFTNLRQAYNELAELCLKVLRSRCAATQAAVKSEAPNLGNLDNAALIAEVKEALESEAVSVEDAEIAAQIKVQDELAAQDEEPVQELHGYELLSKGELGDLDLPTTTLDKLNAAGILDLGDLIIRRESELREILADKAYDELVQEIERRELYFVDRERRNQLLRENKLENLDLSFEEFWEIRFFGVERLDQLLSVTLEDLAYRTRHWCPEKLMKWGLALPSIDHRSEELRQEMQEAKERALQQFLELLLIETDLSYDVCQIADERSITTVGQLLFFPFARKSPYHLRYVLRGRLEMSNLVEESELWRGMEKRIELASRSVPNSIEKLHFHSEVNLYLQYQGILTIEDLTARTEREFYQLLGFEYETIVPIREIVVKAGLKFKKEDPIDPERLSQLCSLSLNDLGLSSRDAKTLEGGHRITRIGDLIYYSPEELLDKRLIGPKMLSVIERKLYQRGLILRYDHKIEEWVDFYGLQELQTEMLAEKIEILPFSQDCLSDFSQDCFSDLHAVGISGIAELVDRNIYDLRAQLGWNKKCFQRLEWALARKCGGLRLKRA